MSDWIKSIGEEIACQDLSVELACEFRDCAIRYAEGVVHLLRAFRLPDGHEVIEFELETGRPQRRVYAINRQEAIGVVFRTDGQAPSVFALRGDFPDTPHQNMVPDEFPCCLCVDDRPWQDAKSTYTGSELLYRIRRWFDRAGVGQLHDLGQALDPYFGGALFNVVVPNSMFTGGAGLESETVALRPIEANSNVLMLKAATPENRRASQDLGAILFLNFTVSEADMERLRKAPVNFLGLCRVMESRGLNLSEELSTIIDQWADDTDGDSAFRLNARLGFLIQMPVIHPATKEVHTGKPVGFLCGSTVGEVGIALGRLFKDVSNTGQRSGYTKNITPGGADEAQLEGIEVGMVAVHQEFDETTAASLAGRDSADRRRITMVGAGAVGSMVAEALCREGRFRWTIIDHDLLLPHNLERHTLNQYDVGCLKSKSVADRLNAIRHDAAATAIDANVLMQHGEKDLVNEALCAADIILDASASTVVARSLCDRTAAGRRASVFFNPAGDTAVLMIEDSERKLDLRHIEAQYYRETLNHTQLREHLSQSVEHIPYAGSCRAVTNRMPYTRASLLSSLLAGGLSDGLDKEEASLAVWSVGKNYTVDAFTVPLKEPQCKEIGDWEVCIDPELESKILVMREERLGNETGGVLLGVVDRIAKRIDLVEAWPEPEDSTGKPSEFKRGIKRLIPDIKKACEATLDQIRYVGEWHSHPDGCTTNPSGTDLNQIMWLTDELAMDGCPSLMIIAGDEGLTFLIGKCMKEGEMS
ncbi:ThiF family adenylyltransferase [Coraliomargarita sp. SDUM461004]|uniref:ThiF family adenylyltransferase n=1 Tax=Thalassobacterium sedimentorum TaxID=3041258 RepID=A0ABU1AJX4_9BACT|nr:ThiF family adenylyltransferase [Coraliomargarita sp. SDUM461004]MDQ8195117.1 ThiF family adenylyltransferase [Coraliomargarita sp. SDUM461004]